MSSHLPILQFPHIPAFPKEKEGVEEERVREKQ